MEFYLQSVQIPQPFLLIMGGSTWNPDQVFVIVERKAFVFPTVAKAVDYAFKLLCVLDLGYQPHCFGVWQFIHSPAVKPTCTYFPIIFPWLCCR